MMRRKWLGIMAFACTGYLHAEARWIHMRSSNFEMYSSAREGATRDTLRYFEQVRSFFLQVTQRAPARPVPVYIVAFGSEKEYAPYRFNEVAYAYYHPGAERDYIVMSHTGSETFPVATHEYVHLVVQHAGLKFPPWLNEGLAELYSTLKPAGDKILVGTLIGGRVQALYSDKWVPLAVILGAGRDSPYYNEKKKAGSFYNESWALVHMLSLSADYRAKFTALLAAIQDGTFSIDALEKTYARPLATIEKDLQIYLRGDRFNGGLLPATLEKDKSALPAEPASAFDVKFALADLTNRPGKEEDARKRLEELTRDDPKRPEPWAALAYMAWHANQHSEAVRAFAKAFELGGRSSRMLWDYGRLAKHDHPEEAARALAELIALEPERADARMELAATQLAVKQPVQALQTLNQVKKVTAADAPRLFTLFAYAEMQLGMLDDARTAVSRLAQYAKTTEDRDRAEQLQRYLNRAAAPPPVAALLDAERPPRFTRREAAAPPAGWEPEPTPSVSGSFVELACRGDTAIVVIDTAQGKKRFFIEDPTKVVVVGRDGGTVDLHCGPQQPAHIKIDYSPGAAAKNTDGMVRVLYFDPE